VHRLDEFKTLVEAQEPPSEDIKVNAETNGAYEQNERLEYAIELLEHLLTNQKDLDERLKKIESQQMMIENTEITTKSDNDSVDEDLEDKEEETLANYNECNQSLQELKKTGRF